MLLINDPAPWSYLVSKLVILGLLTKFHKLRPNHSLDIAIIPKATEKYSLLPSSYFTFYKEVSQYLLHSFVRSFAISYSKIVRGASVSCTSQVCAFVMLLLLIVGNTKIRR